MRLTVNALKRLLGTGLVLSLVSSAPVAFASDEKGQDRQDSDKPDVILYGEADPVQTLWAMTTTGDVRIDGRLARVADSAAHGSRISVGTASTARAEIKGVGRLTIAPRSEVVVDLIDDTIVAQISSGSMRVEAAPRVGTYVETPDSRVVSHPGTLASFRVKADPHSGTSLDRMFGDVELLAVADRDGWDIDTIDEDDDYHVDVRESRRIRIRVENNGSAVPNQAVTFAITSALDGASGSFTDGVQRITTTTDLDGVAEVEFWSGAAGGTIHVEAFVPGTEAHKTLYLFIDAKEPTFWNPATTALYAALGAGAIAGTIIVVKNKGGGRRNNPIITPLPPVVGAAKQ